MILRFAAALGCCLALAPPALAQTRNVAVSAPTRLDWEFVARRFGRDADELPEKYEPKKQKYQLFIPAGYSRKKLWPLIVFISPANDPVGWPAFETVCEREGIFFCCPFKAGNKVAGGLRSRIILDMTDDVRRRFRIDPDQTYIGGFSGGGRMACTVGFALPEVFAGIIPVCGTNPPGPLTYLRHRLVDRVSVAFVTGELDFNRRENEEWMAPYLKELEIRSNLWVVPGVGHDIPGPAVMEDVVAWLAADVQRRREDARARPNLSLNADEAFRDEALASRLLEAAQSELKEPERIWHAVAILAGVISRWPKSETADKARDLLKTIETDPRLHEKLDTLRLKDDRKSFGAQARGLERFGMIPRAIEAWESFARQHPDTPAAEEAQTEISRLKNQLSTPRVPGKP
jgi:predicted esterase